ncbi:hypothetical protein ACFLRW_02995 [Acidobacteriota bacterium]
MKQIAKLAVFSLVLFGLTCFVSAREKKGFEIGVYEYVIQKCDLDFENASNILENSIQSSSFELVASYDQASPEECSLRTRVFVLYDSVYANKIIGASPQTGPFAVADRINLFEDENGLHVSIVNPSNIIRTVLMEDEKYKDLAEAHRISLRSIILENLTGTKSEKQYGPFRKKGYIGRTMGIMAGGAFEDKIENVLVTSGQNLSEIIRMLSSELNATSEKWQLSQVYSVILEEAGKAVVGVSSPAIESRSFSIVKAGGDKSRKELSCPGIAHAAAYPIEIVITQKQNVFYIKLVDAMYRMKMFFEDAGKMAFAANMGMPGSIEKELKKKIKTAFEKN